MNDWKKCKKLLCIRADNMGDVIMSGPAIRGLKKFLNCHITLLTSQMGAGIAPFIPGIDEWIVSNFPWVKSDDFANSDSIKGLIKSIKEKQFDGAVIFTVYSQNPLPTAMLCFLADIPLRLAYCRENPYQLLTHWVPDQEPYSFIKHQVIRDIDLVKNIGVQIFDDHLQLKSIETPYKLPTVEKDYIVIHPSVSEKKRMVPIDVWIKILQALRSRTALPFYLTGAPSEQALSKSIIEESGADHCHCLAGETDIPGFLSLIKSARLLLSVNTSAVHIAAAFQTPVVVLYAATNPQHTPWKVLSEVLYFKVDEQLKSRNEVIRFVNEHRMRKIPSLPEPTEVAEACVSLALQQTPHLI